MRYLSIFALTIIAALCATFATADDLGNRTGDTPNVEVWTNKGNDANYYFGEDVAVYFRADQDCYAVVYDIDPAGEVNVLYPSNVSGSTYIAADKVYRIPDYNDDFHMEVSGNSGSENIFAVASYDYINPPDYMKYIEYDYGQDNYYDNNVFITRVSGNLGQFTTQLNNRIANEPFVVAHTQFFVDATYRHHEHYRYWDTDPYNVGSVWIGCDWPGSEVWIDGVYYGIAPLYLPSIIVGYHWVWVYYGGYPCYQRYFYVPLHQRFFVDVRIDQHFRDYHYRHDNFRHWVFEERRHRNEKDFRDRVRGVPEKNIRTRALPPSVIRDYADRGVISRDSPLVKQIRTDVPDRNIRGRNNAINPDKPTGPIIRDNSGRIKPNNGGQKPQVEEPKNRNNNPIMIEKPNQVIDEKPRINNPDKPRGSSRFKPNNPDNNSSNREKRIEQPKDNNQGNSTPQYEKPKQQERSKSSNENQGNTRSVERQKQSNNDSGRNSSGTNEKSGSRSSGSHDKKARGR
jgi:hypothetical protein